MSKVIPDSTLTLLQPSPFGGFARLGGQVTFRNGKLVSSTVQTRDVAMWRAMMRAIHVELSLMEITEGGEDARDGGAVPG